VKGGRNSCHLVRHVLFGVLLLCVIVVCWF
jgi:hypothetical protein